MCDPNYFMSLGEEKKKDEKKTSQKNSNSAYNMLGVSISAVKKNPTYHSLPLEKYNKIIK